jgi:hypothetical protein
MPANITKSQKEESDNEDEEPSQMEKKDYHKEEQIAPKKKADDPETDAEKEARLKREEDEQMNKIIERSKKMKQMAYMNLKSDVFCIY